MVTEPTPVDATIRRGGTVNPALINPVPVPSSADRTDSPVAWICPVPV